jgi:hypothetical protein
MIFCATRYEDGIPFSEHIESLSWEGARTECILKGWVLDGELIAEISADDISVPEMVVLIDKMNSNKLDS